MDVDKKILKDFSELEKVADIPNIVSEVVEKISSELPKDLSSVSIDVDSLEKVIVRSVEVVPQKTFQWCIPFLPKFWVSRKEE